MNYDIIGDIHGNKAILEKLLLKLGYNSDGNLYSHPNRTAIFLGDFVDRGPDVKGVLQLVKAMVDHGAAKTVIGNHEFNLISFLTKDKKGNYLRKHTAKNIKQISATLESFKNNNSELITYINWFRTLPLFIEENGLRIVHACWQQKDIDFLKKNYPENKLTDQLLFNASNKSKPEYHTIDTVLKGLETELPAAFAYQDNDGNLRNSMRIKWWEDLKGLTLKEAAIREKHLFDNIFFEIKIKYEVYPATAPPVFFGHYCLDSMVRLQQKNVACLDFCVIKNKRLVAYRWDGEQILDEKKWSFS